MRNDLKRRKIYRFLKLNKPDICFVQETHSDKKDSFIWTNEWGNKCIYSHGSSAARGVATLLSKTTCNNVSDVIRDMDGRFLLCKLTIGEYTYCLANVYAPNDDNPQFFQELPQFFQELREKIAEMDCILQSWRGTLI